MMKRRLCRAMVKSLAMPRTIAEHPGVQEALWGEAEGFDYKYHVWLKEGWSFHLGRMEGCRTGNFHTVSDFLKACPKPVSAN